MGVLEHWRYRHPTEPGSTGRLIVLILLLAMVIAFILNSDKLARGLTFFFSSSRSGAETSE